MANDISSMVDEALGRLGERGSRRNEAAGKAYERLREQTEAGYRELDREAYVNRALSDRATGSADGGMTTLRQRRESNQRNILGKSGQQRTRTLDTLRTAQESDELQRAADEAAQTAALRASQSAAELSELNFGKQLGLGWEQLEQQRQNSTFWQNYNLLESGWIDRKGFKDETGIEVRNRPKRSTKGSAENTASLITEARRQANESKRAAFMEKRLEDNAGWSESVKSGIPESVSPELSRAAQVDRRLAEWDSYMKAPEIVPLSTADVLQANAEDWKAQYGEGSYNAAQAFLMLQDAYADVHGTTLYTNMNDLNDVLFNGTDYISEFGEKDYERMFEKALDAAWSTYFDEILPSLIEHDQKQQERLNLSFTYLQENFPKYVRGYTYGNSAIEEIRKKNDELPESFNIDEVVSKLTLPDWFEIPEKWDATTLLEAMSLSAYLEWDKHNTESSVQAALPQDGVILDGARIASQHEEYEGIVERAASLPDIYNSPEAASLEAQLRREGSSWEDLTLGQQAYYGAVKIDNAAKAKGQEVASTVGVSITDEQALQAGGLYNYIMSESGDEETRQQAELEAIATYGATEMQAGEYKFQYSTVTGFILDTTYDELDEDTVFRLNEIIATEMMNAHLGNAHNEANLEELRENGLAEIADLIESKEEGCYFEMSEYMVDQMVAEIVSGFADGNAFALKLDTASYTDQQVRQNSDFEEVVASPPIVSTNWNPYFPPGEDDLYGAVRAGYIVNQGVTDNWEGLVQKLHEQLERGEITQEEYDYTVASLENSLDGTDIAGNLSGFSFITQEMYDTFTYLYVEYKRTGDNTALYNYFNIFKQELTEAQWQAYYGQIEGLVEEKGPWGEMLSAFVAAGGKGAAIFAYPETLSAAITGREVDTTSSFQLLARSGDAFSELATSTTDSEFGKWMIQTSIDFVAAAPGFAAGGIGGAAYIGLQAAGQDAARQNLMGASAWESAAHSTVIGGVTTFTSAVMLKGFGSVIGGTTLSLPATFGQKVMTYSLNAIASFGLGASTAAVGTAAGNLADMLLKGEHSTYAQLVAQYKGKGMAEDNAKAAAAVELFAKQPIIAGLENGAIAAAMSLPATAAALRAAETMGGRAMVADEQGAFKRLHALEAETKIVDTANKAVDVYTELIALPKEVLPDANLKALQTAYRNFEANATAENASALLKEVDASVRVASQKMGSGITANAGYRRYLNILDEVAAANKAGMTAREFAASKGVSSTLTDAEAAAADTAGLKMEMDEDGTGGYNGGAGMGSTIRESSPYDLTPTHSRTLSNRKFGILKEQIRIMGIQEPIKYVEYNGVKYVVDGHHRLTIAKLLGITEVPIEKVELPYLGYANISDLLWYE